MTSGRRASAAACSVPGRGRVRPSAAVIRRRWRRPRSARSAPPGARRVPGCTGDGRLALEGFPVADISDHLADESVTVWLDLRDPDRDDLGVVSEEFGLHPLAVEDALHHSQRPKLDRYPSHLFLTAYATKLDAGTGELMTSELAAFITRQALITVRKDDGLDIGAVIDRWDSSLDLAGFGVGYLLYGLLDYVVDTQFESVQNRLQAQRLAVKPRTPPRARCASPR
jgi:Mg2+ and Co2+ transporter CorA